MIRLVRFDGQLDLEGTEPAFAWYDTVADRFIELGGEQAWSSWDEFLSAYQFEQPNYDIERFRRLYREEFT